MNDRAKRTATRVPVSVSSAQPGHRAALTANVSRDGICLESPTEVPLGSEIKGYVLHGDLELGWVGRVAWTEPGDPDAGVWHQLGVRFTSLSPGLRELLSDQLS